MEQKWTVGATARGLGTSDMTVYRYLNGISYPQVKMMRKIEVAFGWLARDQIELIPAEGHDLLYGMMLTNILDEHAEHTA